MYRIAPSEYSTPILFGFTAGFLATFTFLQFSVWVLWSLGVSPFVPYSMAATKPFGVPVFVSQAFWGGIWGILFALVERRFPAHGGYWVVAFLFGAVLLSLVLLLVVLPLHGRPLGGGWHPPFMLTAFIANGAWGIGTGLFLRVMAGWFSRRRHSMA
ncbi:MAG: hypothetical protein ABSG91_12735 [Syntrophobacteraceae bacterium]|jgi:hypothetical protein